MFYYWVITRPGHKVKKKKKNYKTVSKVQPPIEQQPETHKPDPISQFRNQHQVPKFFK